MAEQYFLEDGNLHPSYTVRDFSFSQRWSWALRSSGAWRCVNEWFPSRRNVLEISGTTHPATQRHTLHTWILLARFWPSIAVQLRSSLFWDVKRWWLVLGCRRSGTTHRSHLKVKAWALMMKMLSTYTPQLRKESLEFGHNIKKMIVKYKITC